MAEETDLFRAQTSLEEGRCYQAVEPLTRYIESGERHQRIQALQLHDEAVTCAEHYTRAMHAAEEALAQGYSEAVVIALRRALTFSAEPVAMLLLAESLLNLNRCTEAGEVIQSLAEAEQNQTQQRLASELEEQFFPCIEAASTTGRPDCTDARESLITDFYESTLRQRVTGITLTSLGAALLIGAITHDIGSQTTIDAFEFARDSGDIAREAQLRDAIHARQTVSFALFGSATILTAVGAVFWIASGRSNPMDTADCSELTWGIGGPGAAGGWVDWRF